MSKSYLIVKERPAFSDKDDKRAGVLEDAGPQRTQIIMTILWCCALVAGIWLLGFVLFVPVFILLYLKTHQEKWPLTISLSVLTFVILKGFFLMLLKVHLYQGYIPDLLMRHDIFYF